MRTLCIAFAALLLAGCAATNRPQLGGRQTTTFGGAASPTIVSTLAPENPQTPSTTTVEKTTVRDYAPPPRNPSSQDRSAVDHLIHNQEAAGSNPAPAPMLREFVHERATTQLGTAQPDTVRDLGARLANMRGVMWVGVLLLVAGPIVGWKMGWFTNGAIAGGVGLLLIILAQIVPGNEAWFGLAGLFLIPGVAFVYYRSRHDAATTPRDHTPMARPTE